MLNKALLTIKALAFLLVIWMWSIVLEFANLTLNAWYGPALIVTISLSILAGIVISLHTFQKLTEGKL
jgi:hypothetical protein